MGKESDKQHLAASPEEWDALQARLRDAEEKLSQADRRNEEFLAMLAHELRNPLAPIRSAVEIMDVIGQKDAALEKARQVIERQVDHLSRLVDDLLDMSHITQGKISLTKTPVDVNAVLSGAVEIVRPLMDERRHRLTVAPLPGPVSVEGDMTRLVQIIGNLLNNAAKYTDEGGEITLSAHKQGELAVITVADNGIGIATDLLPHVFDLFTQAHRTAERPQGGLGIGLSLVRNLLLMHGGSVQAFSRGPGEGSEFVVQLPVVPQPARVEQPVQRHSGRDSLRRIVVIDDNRDAAESMAMLLRLRGHEVQVAYDGPSGVSMALKTKPDCVVVDIGLPGIDGYEVAKRLRSHEAGRRLLLIALTGYGQAEDRARSEQAGFDHHLVKPAAQNVLEDLIREA